MFGAKADNSSEFSGKGENLRSGSIVAKITVTVTNVRNNGDLVIEGSRVIGINGEEETIFLTGVVRSRDISSNNSIQSYQIADAEISKVVDGTWALDYERQKILKAACGITSNE